MIRHLFGRDRVSYRRLLAFVVATVLLWTGRVDQTTWGWVTAAFMGLEAVTRVATMAQSGR